MRFHSLDSQCYQRCKTDPPQRLKIDPGVNLLLWIQGSLWSLLRFVWKLKSCTSGEWVSGPLPGNWVFRAILSAATWKPNLKSRSIHHARHHHHCSMNTAITSLSGSLFTRCWHTALSEQSEGTRDLLWAMYSYSNPENYTLKWFSIPKSLSH